MIDENIYKVINGNNLDVLDTLGENSVDAIVTDPPYELGFMGKKWDSTGIAYNVELWKRALRVLKPGGYLLAFGGSRTFHRIAVAIEDAGFEIRDTIMWLYGSGFPKSHNIGLAVDELRGIESKVVGYQNTQDLKEIGKLNGHKMTFGQENDVNIRTQTAIKKAQNEWAGWGTALKPAFEPIVMARKPISESNIAENCLKWGVGGINIDGCRVETFEGDLTPRNNKVGQNGIFNASGGYVVPNEDGRFPANIITDGSDEVASGMPNTKSAFNPNNKHETEIHRENADTLKYGYAERYETGFNDEGSAMRYFYCAKASKKDRDDGLDAFEEMEGHEKGNGLDRICEFCGESQLSGKCKCEHKSWVAKTRRNVHPTVKPVELMEYLVKLVSPKGATIMDIFNGSGSTGKAVAFLNREENRGYKYIGIELMPEYCEISKARIDYAINKYEYDAVKEKQDDAKKGQIDLFDFEWE